MIYFLVNPDARSGKGTRIWHKTASILNDRQVPHKCVMLTDPGMAADFARACSESKEERTVVIVGGDGTINEFLSGLTDPSRTTLGCIPVGSGNDFARALGISTSPEAALSAILDHPKVRDFNIGRTVSEDACAPFAVSTGIGFDAAVCHESEQSALKSLLNRLGLGKLIYTANALRMLWRMQPFSLSVRAQDGQVLHYRDVWFAAAMNTPYEGGGFRFCPQADPADGQLDLMVASGIPKWKVLLILPTAYLGAHTHFRGISIIRSPRFSLSASSPQCVHTDGEHFGFQKKVSFGLRKETLRVIS